MVNYANYFKNKKVLITGGLGFIGSNLAIKLNSLGAKIEIIDALIPEHGGNVFNISTIKESVKIYICGIENNPNILTEIIPNQDFVFNLAGQSSHWDSMIHPNKDLSHNCSTHLALLESIHRFNTNTKIVFTSTRQVYGKPQFLPVNETHPINPIDINGIHKATAEQYHLLYHKLYGLKTSILRLTNTFGPRMRLRDDRQSFLGIWFRYAVEKKKFEVWGGTQKRDFNYIDDVVDALLLSAMNDIAIGKIYNLGNHEYYNLIELAEKLSFISNCPFIVKEFPEYRKGIDIGDYYSDFDLIRRDLNWTPKIKLDEGLKMTYNFVKKNINKYSESYGGFKNIKISDPKSSFNSYKDEIISSIHRVIESGVYIGGEEVSLFEKEFSEYLGVNYVISTGSGTDAIHLALRSLGIKNGDKVATVSHTAVATVAAIELVGAIPIFVDVDPNTFTMDINSLQKTLIYHKSIYPLNPIKAIIPVHLYGHPADMIEIMDLSEKYKCSVIEDCAQAHGAAINDKKCGTWGHVGAFSFYPTKNLGCLGDGGALTTSDSKIANKAKLIKEYGWEKRYISKLPGFNTRLDSIQAAILRSKLKHLDEENTRRIYLANIFNKELSQKEIVLPSVKKGYYHIYHQYVIKSQYRDSLKKYLDKRGIITRILYPVPIHLQPAYKERIKIESDTLINTENIYKQILCLPIHTSLSDEEVNYITTSILSFKSINIQI